MRFVRPGPILLKDEEFARHLEYGEQQLLFVELLLRRF